MATVYIALGTNLGDRLANLKAAIDAMTPRLCVLAQSPVYETEPWGFVDQPKFMNQVIRADTSSSPQDLLAFLKHLEASLGRVPTFRNGPRLIDLDILFYGDLVLNTPDLVIPHPHLTERSFVLVPLADLAPTLRHPSLGKTMVELLEGVDRSLVHRVTGTDERQVPTGNGMSS